jgi:hypothetical protein
MIISEGIPDLLHGGFIFVMIFQYQYLFLNSFDLVHLITGSCHLGLFGISELN